MMNLIVGKSKMLSSTPSPDNKPVSAYVKTGVPVNFHTLSQVAARRGEMAIGYKIEHTAAGNGETHGVTISPAKDGLVTFAPEDRLVVLAND